ncbi:XdhC family protein [Allomuricauda sp. d1]|uniref:XdhC family protein n=1 Tax=Allomuricauda sp. d1 TaxID=3136725 RepID=UPI0031D82FE0
MTHELKKIIRAYEKAAALGVKSVLATVVALDGSSYRRPGVRMLLLENGTMVGAVSGGCVEKEVFRQAESVFKSGIPKMMTYDGRYRLGCEGILYVLLEPMDVSTEALKAFHQVLKARETFNIESFYQKGHAENKKFGSQYIIGDSIFPFRSDTKLDSNLDAFKQKMNPCFRLVIIGAEHDAVQLCSFAAMTGWEVTMVVHPKEEKTIEDFPGATTLIADEGETMNLVFDDTTALMLMTHSYVKDLKYLIALKEEKPSYFGLLGPARRREKLFDELLEVDSDINPNFLEQINGPAGLDIGAETPQEIALAILSEIIAVVNEKEVNSLKEKQGKIHA